MYYNTRIYCMDLSEKDECEFIEEIYSSCPRDEDENASYDNDLHFAIFKLTIQTNLNKTIIRIKPELMEKCVDFDINILDDNFSPVDQDFFNRAILFDEISDINELKRDAKFLKYIKTLAKRNIHGSFQFQKFATSKGNFYIEISIWWEWFRQSTRFCHSG